MLKKGWSLDSSTAFGIFLLLLKLLAGHGKQLKAYWLAHARTNP